jgi:hypothetical protein
MRLFIAALSCLVSCCLAFGASGCFAWAGPPIRYSFAVTDRVIRGAHGPSADPRFDARVAVHPTPLLWPPEKRPFDVGVGYLIQPAASSSDHQALFVEISPPLLRLAAIGSSDDGGTLWNILAFTVRGSREWEWDLSGFGGALQIAYDWRIFSRGRNACGVFSGDWGVGLMAEGGFAQIEGTRIWTSTFGISARLPGAVYFAWENQRC